MIIPRANISESLIDRVSHWLQQSALGGSDLEGLVHGLCERLAAAGVPLLRVHLSFSMLHPLYDALGFTWIRGKGVSVEGFRATTSDGEKDRFLRSPYFYLLSNGLPHLRRRIDPMTSSEFGIFDDLKEWAARIISPSWNPSARTRRAAWSAHGPPMQRAASATR
jgi:adenylate cyclase